ncbi:transporter [Yersinia enterocolitica]|nr:transporter [Yersinia enterocolitica]
MLILAGCASSDNIAPQSQMLDNQQLQLAPPKSARWHSVLSGGGYWKIPNLML